MLFAEISGGRLHYQFDGDTDAPVLMLSNSLGTDLSMWQRQVAALSLKFRVLRYDSRGQGRSLVTAGPYSIELLARDALALLDRLEIPRVHFCGLSLGGMIGMWLAAHEPRAWANWCSQIRLLFYLRPRRGTRGLNRFKWEESPPSSTLSWSAGLHRHFGKAGHSMSKPHDTRCSPLHQMATSPALRPSATWICAPNCDRFGPTLSSLRAISIQQLLRRWAARSLTRLTELALLNFWRPIYRTSKLPKRLTPRCLTFCFRKGDCRQLSISYCASVTAVVTSQRPPRTLPPKHFPIPIK